MCLCAFFFFYLFQNHQLIQEVKTFASEEFPDGLLPLEALRVCAGARWGGLVLQELQQTAVLSRKKWIDGRKTMKLIIKKG